MRVSTLLVAIPVVAAAGVIAVANRAEVTFSLDPFSTENPALALEIPLFLLIFLALLFGVLLGGFTVWWSRTAPARKRRAAAQKE